MPVDVIERVGVRETENVFFPERGTGEFLMMHVGPRYQKRPLYAVTRPRHPTIKDKLKNLIEVRIFEGVLIRKFWGFMREKSQILSKFQIKFSNFRYN